MTSILCAYLSSNVYWSVYGWYYCVFRSNSLILNSHIPYSLHNSRLWNCNLPEMHSIASSACRVAAITFHFLIETLFLTS